MSFLIFPPEVNSALMYSGAGAGPLYIASAAWAGLASELRALASSFDSVVTGLAGGPWSGPASTTMLAAAAPYVGWMSAAAGQAELAASQARVAATAFESAQTATVHPAAVTANRVSLTSLVATNFLGQNTPAIAATEFDYVEMWAQDLAAMLGYHGSAAAVASTLTPLAVPPNSLAGLESGIQSAVTGLQSLASGVPVESLASVAQFATLPVSMLMSPLMSLAQSANGAGLAGTAATGLAADIPKLAADVVPGMTPLGGGLGSAASGGLGQAHLVGAMSVPPTWAGSAPARMASSALSGLGSGLGQMPSAATTGGTGGMPMMPMPMGGAGAAGAGLPGGMLGRGGGGPQVVQTRPSVVPRVGVG